MAGATYMSSLLIRVLLKIADSTIHRRNSRTVRLGLQALSIKPYPMKPLIYVKSYTWCIVLQQKISRHR